VIAVDRRAMARELLEAIREDEKLRLELAAALVAEPSPALITIAEYARRRSISQSTVRAAIRDGRLPSSRIGRAIRIDTRAEIAEPGHVRPRIKRTEDRAARALGLRGGRP